MSSTIITELDIAVQHNNAAWDATSQRRRDALESFEGNTRNRTWPKLNAYKDTDKSWFPNLVHILATQGLISGRILDKALDAAWIECGSNKLTLPMWAELYNLANGKTVKS